jgi:hypothetical protein
MTVALVSAIIGFALAGTILYLVRRDHLHGSYALWWLAVAAATLVLGVFPPVVDQLGHLIGINYPPILPIIVGMGFILIRMLQMDVDRSRQERALRRLTQRIAILDQELTETRAALANGGKQISAGAETSVPPRKSAQVIPLPKSSGES